MVIMFRIEYKIALHLTFANCQLRKRKERPGEVNFLLTYLWWYIVLELCYQEKFRQICALATVPFLAAIIMAVLPLVPRFPVVFCMKVAKNNY